jgi:uncharacterized protein (TIGR03083 family)
MEIPALIDSLQRDGDLLAAAAASSGPDAAIPTCPGWKERDLLLHVGGVHRWATGYVDGAVTDPDGVSYAELVEPPPDDATFVDWFREGHAALVGALRGAPADLECWTFLPAPSPLAFWARRQAHETAIHRVDAESGSGPFTAFAPDIARDGIDELLTRFATRPRSRDVQAPRTLQVHATDGDGDWHVTIRAEGIDVTEGRSAADCSVAGTASDLYTLLWNRRGTDGLDVDGDPAVLDLWRESVRIRWS